MFDIGFSEMVLLAAIALIAIGPKQLPEVARVAGRMLADLKRTSAEFTRSFLEARDTTTGILNDTNRQITDTHRQIMDSIIADHPVVDHSLSTSAPLASNPHQTLSSTSGLGDEAQLGLSAEVGTSHHHHSFPLDPLHGAEQYREPDQMNFDLAQASPSLNSPASIPTSSGVESEARVTPAAMATTEANTSPVVSPAIAHHRKDS